MIGIILAVRSAIAAISPRLITGGSAAIAAPDHQAELLHRRDQG